MQLDNLLSEASMIRVKICNRKMDRVGQMSVIDKIPMT